MAHLLARLRARHPSDEQLVELCLASDHDAADLRHTIGHLRVCRSCLARYEEVVGLLRASRHEAIAEADARFGPARLARQRTLIARRLEGLERPTRVLPFPVSHRPVPGRRPGVRRWVASAAAAGLLLGLATGRFIDLYPHASRASLPTARTTSAGDPTARPTPAAHAPLAATRLGPSDELFLVEIDSALAGPAAVELQAIDAITPRVMEVGFNLRDGA